MKKYFILLSLFSILLLITGCNNNNEANTPTRSQDNASPLVNVKNSPNDDIQLDESQKISQHLANLAGNMPNVENASAVAIGKYAIVAIDVNKDLDRSKVGAIKYTVAEALKKDPNGANAVVVADPDFRARIDEINQDIKNGKPVQGILNELSDIMGRIMPEIPGDLKDPSVERQMEEPKEETNQKDARDLDQMQNEQSNNQKENKQ